MSGNMNGDRSNGISFGRRSDRAASKLSRTLRTYVDRDFDENERETTRRSRFDEGRSVEAPHDEPPGWARS